MLVTIANIQTLVLVLLSIVIPHVSSLISKRHWDTYWTGVITLVLSTVNGLVIEFFKEVNDHYSWKQAASMALTSWFVAFMTRFGILRGTQKDARLVAAGSDSNRNQAV